MNGAMPTLRVALLQAPCSTEEPAQNLATLARAAAHYAASADLLITPELFVTGYGGTHTHAQPAACGSYLDAVTEIVRAHGISILYGFAEVADDGTTQHISCSLVGGSPPQRLFTYRKAHLWTPSPFEAANFTPGRDEPPVVTLKGVRISPLICFDVEVGPPAGVVHQQANR